MKLLFLIRSLRRGGAERQLVEIVKGLDKAKFSSTIVTFYDENEFSEDLHDSGIQVISLQKRGRWNNISFLVHLIKLIQEMSPDAIHSYLPVANTFALIAGKLSRVKVIWGLRASYINFKKYDWAAAWIFRIESWLSHWVDLIVVNSEAGYKHHIDQGYCKGGMVIIPNGIDTKRFIPDHTARKSLREELGLLPDTPLIGFVARFDPQKDHQTFIKAASLLNKGNPGIHFVLSGHNVSRDNTTIMGWLNKEEVAAQFHLLGTRTDMARITAAFDIATLLSFGEGFPNVVGEAMSCGIPCVSTDVGDAKIIIGDTGKIIPAESPNDLAAAWIELLLNIERLNKQLPSSFGVAARNRIEEYYSVEEMVERTSRIFVELLTVG